MPSLNAFKQLDPAVRKAIIARVAERKQRYLKFTTGSPDKVADILLVGDRPAPSAPDDPRFHYTPFGALWNSSLWLNLQLELNEIPEARLSWLNATDFYNTPTDHRFLTMMNWRMVVALGGKAESWLKKSELNLPVHKVHHPQAWKRFHAREPYPLIALLKSVLYSS